MKFAASSDVLNGSNLSGRGEELLLGALPPRLPWRPEWPMLPEPLPPNRSISLEATWSLINSNPLILKGEGADGRFDSLLQGEMEGGRPSSSLGCSNQNLIIHTKPSSNLII